MNPPSNWSQVPMRIQGKASSSGLEEIRRSVIAISESRDGFLDDARQPVALIGSPPPLRTFAERQSALALRVLPLSRARS